MRSKIRLIVPDSHGAHIDLAARDALLKDAKALTPDEIVWLGDHLDCGGTFSSHGLNFTEEMEESYVCDSNAANDFLDLMGRAAPKAGNHYLFGNHEAHVERWAARTFRHKRDADKLLATFGPAQVLQLKARGFKWYLPTEHYHGLSVPGSIRLGKCFYTHGISHSRHAAQVHLARFGQSVVFGHVHRSQSVIERTVTSDGFGAWCPGALCKLQPLYRHTAPTSWTHGYAVQFVAPSGRFLHLQIPIISGRSLLLDVVDQVHHRKRKGKT